MANTKTVTNVVDRHALLDIEIEIDEGINSRILDIKNEYKSAIEEFKTVRNDNIKAVRAERKTLLTEAKAELLEA